MKNVPPAGISAAVEAEAAVAVMVEEAIVANAAVATNAVKMPVAARNAQRIFVRSSKAMTCLKQVMDRIRLFLVLFVFVPLSGSLGGAVFVLLPDGSPASRVRVACVRTERFIEVRNGVGVDAFGQALPEGPGDGRVDVPEKEYGRFVFLHPQGWADVDVGAETREIRLQTWNEIRGNVVPSAGQASRVTYSRIESRGGTEEDRGVVYWTGNTSVLPDRTFTMGFVPAGRGVLGVERAVMRDRRGFAWSDFPKEVAVPISGLVSLGDPGAVLRGRLPKSTPGPAMVEVNDRAGKRSAFFGMTDAAGAFVISGLASGDFRLSARPLDERLGKYHVQREFSVPAEVRDYDLGELPAPAPDVEIYRMIEYPEGLIEKVRAEATEKSRQPIQKIWLGQLAHPIGLWGARVTFAPEPVDDTHAMARTFVVRIPAQTIRKFYPEHNRQGYGYRFGIGEFSEPRLIEETVRIFPLKGQTLYLPVSGDLKYETALALLKAIEAQSWKNPPSPKSAAGGWPSGYSAGVSLDPEDLPRIESIRREKPGGRIEVHTRDGDFSGKSAQFEEKNGEFILVEGGIWQA